MHQHHVSLRALTRRAGTAGVAGVLVLLCAIVGPAAVAATPVPVTPTDLPTDIEPLAAYVPADSCDPTAKSGTVDLAQLLTATYSGTSYAISRVCGTDSSISEHYEGRALDWMVSVRDATQKAEATTVIHWLFATDSNGNAYANARRLGVMYILWNNRIWGAYRASDGWRAYSTCASHPEKSWDTTCHRNHMHVSLSWESAMAATSFWSKQVAARDYGPCRVKDMNWARPYLAANPTPCTAYSVVRPAAGASAVDRSLVAYSGIRLISSSTGPAVVAVQKALKVTATGHVNAATRAAVRRWQTGHALDATGVVNVPTWRSLLKAFQP